MGLLSSLTLPQVKALVSQLVSTIESSLYVEDDSDQELHTPSDPAPFSTGQHDESHHKISAINPKIFTRDTDSPRGSQRRLNTPSSSSERKPKLGLGLHSSQKTAPSESAESSKKAVNKGLSSRAAASASLFSNDDSDDEADSLNEQPAIPPQIQNKLVGRASAASSDFPSPRLSDRGLGHKHSNSAADSSDPFEQEESSSSIATTPIDNEDLITAPKSKAEQLRAEQSLVAAPSPRQKTASLQLLNLTKDASSDRVNSPKPGFLRRLDAPDSHHGKLLRARADLRDSITSIVPKVPRVRQESVFII